MYIQNPPPSGDDPTSRIIDAHDGTRRRRRRRPASPVSARAVQQACRTLAPAGAPPASGTSAPSASGDVPDPDALRPTLVPVNDDRVEPPSATAVTGIDVSRQAPQTAAWLAQRGLALHRLEVWSPARKCAQTYQAWLLADVLQRQPLASPLLRLIRRALNRVPTLALRAEARRQANGLTVEAAAAAIGIPVDAYVRYVRSGHGLIREQREKVAKWAPPDEPGKRIDDALHAAAAVDDLAVRAGVSPDVARDALEQLIADLLPLRLAGLLDGMRVMRHRQCCGDKDGACDVMHVWVSPDPPAKHFFTGGWLSLVLADRLHALAPTAETCSELALHHPNIGSFGVALVTVRGTAALVVEPMTTRDPERRIRRLHQLRCLAPLLTDGDPRRVVVVLAPPDDPLSTDADWMAHLGATFGVTVTGLIGADAALRAALRALPA